MTMYDFFDLMLSAASSNDTSFTNLTSVPIYGNGGDDTSYVGRNLQLVTSSSSNSNEEDSPPLLFCHIPTLLRYSTPTGKSTYKKQADFSGGSVASGDVVGGGDIGQIAYAASAGIILALHHANTGNGSVASQLHQLNERCPIRFTTEFLDKGGSGLDSVTALAELVTRQPPSAGSYGQPCSIIGAHVSDASSKLASLAAVFDLPVVSSSAMSTELNNIEQYPTFLRTHTDVGGFGEMSVSYLRNNLGIRKFGMLFTNDSYGYGFSKSVLDAAMADGAEVVGGGMPYIAISNDDDETELRATMEALSNTGCNYFVGNFYAESFAKVMSIALEYGLIGNGKVWLISGTADMAPYILGGALKVSKTLGEALAGNGIYFCKGGVPGLGGTYDTFTKIWKALAEDNEALSYINNKQPLKEDGTKYEYPPSFFTEKLPHHVVTFSYDAGVGLALSACKAWDKSLNYSSAFSGNAHYEEFANSTYEGASGDIRFRKEFPTRTAESSYFVMANLVAVTVDDNSTLVKFAGSPIIEYLETTTSTWEKLPGKEFTFSDGTKTAPPEMVPSDDSITSAVIIAIVLAIALVSVIGAVLIMRMRQKRKDIKAWEVNPSELKFEQPPVVIGRGTFGLVLLAQYRGTFVAVKRVIPRQVDGKRNQRSGSLAGSLTKPRRNSEGVSSIEDDKFDLENNGNHSGENVHTDRRVSFVDIDKDNIKDSDEWVDNIKGAGSGSSYNSFNHGILSGTVTNTPPNTKKRWLSIKSIGKDDANYSKLKSDFIDEMKLLATLRHPNICTVMGACVTLGNEPMLIMEYMQMGSLFGLLHNETVPLSGELILPILQDVAKGVRFLHSANQPIVHRDLKSANILVDSRFHAKVSDFGLSQKKKVGATGTPYWMAPELLRKEADNTPASDVYSFGIILFEAYTRKIPYEGEDYDNVIKLVASKSVQKRPPIPGSAPPQIKSMMTECLSYNAVERPIFEELDARLQRLTAETADITDTIRSHRLNQAQAGSDLLYDNFPKPVADQLRSGHKVEPESHSCVSIFFSDIVGFTDISSKLTPMKVSNMLDRLYNSFDDLSRTHDVFKIETIGDAYLAVTNLVSDQNDHAKRIVDFAIEALHAANQTVIDVDDPSLGCVNIRVGLHSGPVVASVVGSRNLKYSIFGDTVNVAARMEQNSENNRIHSSDITTKLLQIQDPSRSIRPRGSIKVKGKALPMETFWVNE